MEDFFSSSVVQPDLLELLLSDVWLGGRLQRGWVDSIPTKAVPHEAITSR